MCLKIQDKLTYNNCLSTYPYCVLLATHNVARLQLLNQRMRQTMLGEGMVSFQCSTILNHIPSNLHIIFGL